MVIESFCQNQSVTPKTFYSNGYMNLFRHKYGIQLLRWHSVTNGLEAPHGVRAYGCTKKWEDSLFCTGITAKIKVLQQKHLVLMHARTFSGAYSIKLSWWYSVTNCLGGPTRGPNIWIINWTDFLWCSRITVKNKVLSVRF